MLYTVDGVEVRLGADEWDARLGRLEGVLAQVATQDVHGVDLRFRDQVVFEEISEARAPETGHLRLKAAPGHPLQ